ncbi:MAG: hypothetical protein V2G44_02675 [bacterium JZ-2024 1]
MSILAPVVGAVLSLHFMILDYLKLEKSNCPRYAQPICIVLRKTRWYRLLFGVPNPVWAFFYFVTCACAISTLPHPGFKAFAVAGALYAIALQAITVFQLRMFCVMCLIFTILAIITAIFVLL